MNVVRTRIIVVLASLCLAALSSAQTTGGGSNIDLTPVTTAASSQFVSFMTTNAPALIGILLVGLTFKLVIKFLRRGVSG